MIYETLDKRIAEAMIEEKNVERKYKTNFWKAVKTEMVNAIHNGVNLQDEEAEMKILKTMLKRSKNAIECFEKAAPTNKVAMENLQIHKYEAGELEKLLPKEIDPASVKIVTNTMINDLIARKKKEDSNFDPKTLQRYTKEIIEKVKLTYPTANNRVIAEVIKSYIN